MKITLCRKGYNAANVAYEQGITSGIGNGEFAPERTITAEEFSAMILRLTDIGDFDWQNSVNILVEQGDNFYRRRKNNGLIHTRRYGKNHL